MTVKGSAAEPGKNDRQAANQPATTLTTAQVVDYLSSHPDFLIEHPELFDILTPPSRASGRAVVDMQHFMLERLRSENQRLKDSHAGLVATVRGNQSTQNRIHAAILRIVAANSFNNLIQSVTIDLPVMLGIDVVTICIEAGDVPIPKAYSSGCARSPQAPSTASWDQVRMSCLPLMLRVMKRFSARQRGWFLPWRWPVYRLALTRQWG